MRTSNKQGPKTAPSVERKADYQKGAVLSTASLPEHVSRNIETIIDLHARHEKEVSRHQRFVEDLTLFFGRPRFLYSILFLIVLWITSNSVPRRFRLPRFDPPSVCLVAGVCYCRLFTNDNRCTDYTKQTSKVSQPKSTAKLTNKPTIRAKKLLS